MNKSVFNRPTSHVFVPIVFSLIFFLASCASTNISAVSESNPHIDMSKYETFSWIAEDPLAGSRGRLTDRNKKRIEDAIVSNLVEKGYVQTSNSGAADFVVSYTVGNRKKLTKASYPDEYHSGWRWTLPTYADYRDKKADLPGYRSSSQLSVYTEGTLAIDLFDVDAHEPAWHGYAEKEITRSDRRAPTVMINDAVTSILKQFPDVK